MVSFTRLSRVWPRWVLRSVDREACDGSLPFDKAPHHRRLRSSGRLGMVLSRRGIRRVAGSDTPYRANPSLLLNPFSLARARRLRAGATVRPRSTSGLRDASFWVRMPPRTPCHRYGVLPTYSGQTQSGKQETLAQSGVFYLKRATSLDKLQYLKLLATY